MLGDVALGAVNRGNHPRAQRETPIASKAHAIVFAVYWPPHAPARARASLELVQVLVAHLAGRVGAHALEHVLDRHVLPAPPARHDRAPYSITAGTSRRAIAITAPGIVLSHPDIRTSASNW